MNAERMRRARAVFDEVCDLGGEEREGALARLCGEDGELRGEVERMLRFDSQELGPIAQSGAGASLLAAELGAGEPGIPEKIGRYRVIREIGRGGMGVVYEAEQESPRRRVALKVVQRGLASQAVLSRFHREAQVLGQLQHRGIAHIYESGTARIGEGRWPFLAMELVEGQPLDKHAEALGFSASQRLELMARVCDAVQHAHQKGVIHRDLKPANVLVVGESTATATSQTATVVDAIGQPKILDFGVARFADPEAQQTVQTHAGQIVGTLAYMSPEQLAGRVDAIDTRSDVYALGVILFRLLAGRAPYELGGVPIAQAARTIAEENSPTLGAIEPALRGDVSTIVGKAMEKDPERRYASAAALAEDIRRYLRDEPIEARPASAAYQLRKFARRNRALVGGVCATFVALAGGLIAASVLLARVSAQRDLASIAEDRAVRIGTFQGEMLSSINIDSVGSSVIENARRQLEALGFEQSEIDRFTEGLSGAALASTAIDTAVLSSAVERLDRGYFEEPAIEAELRGSIANVYGGLGLLDKLFIQTDRAAALVREARGPEALETIRAERRRADALHAIGRYEEAAAALQELLERAIRVSVSDARLMHTIRTSLAATLIPLGRLEEAEQILDEELDRLMSSPEPPRDWVFGVEARLAGVRLQKGDYSEAAAALAGLSERVRGWNGGEDNPTSLNLLSDLTIALERGGRPGEAEAVYRRLIDGWQQLWGEDDYRTFRARSGLGNLLFGQGRIDEALAELRLAHGSALRTETAASRRRTDATIAFARCLLEAGGYAECERVVGELVDARHLAGMPDDDTDGQTLQEILDACRRARSGS